MRKGGKSIKTIARAVYVSQSTVSYWCRDILLSPIQLKHLQTNARSAAVSTLLLAAERKRKKRLEETMQYTLLGEKDVGEIKKRDLFIYGLGLYQGEGYQSKTEGVGFTNSNPHVIKIFIYWLGEIYNINRENLTLRVSINGQHQDRVEKVLEYWSQLTKIPISQFTKTSLIEAKSKKQYRNRNQYYGTLRIKVKRGTNLKRRIVGSLISFEKHGNPM